MQFANRLLCYTLIVLGAVAMYAQGTASSATTVVPPLVNFSGAALNNQGKALTGVVGVTFSIYNAQEGGAPLWMETQNVTADAKGNYTVQLGAASSEGLPLNLFSSGEARWLGVRVSGSEEQARVLLLSVPYALKAADAQTVGGLPASAFVLAAPAGVQTAAAQASSSSSSLRPTLAARARRITFRCGPTTLAISAIRFSINWELVRRPSWASI